MYLHASIIPHTTLETSRESDVAGQSKVHGEVAPEPERGPDPGRAAVHSGLGEEVGELRRSASGNNVSAEVTSRDPETSDGRAERPSNVGQGVSKLQMVAIGAGVILT
jgi:hypothetical protein